MQHQRPGQPLQLLEMGRTHRLPLTFPAPFEPMPLAIALLKGPLIRGQGMTNGGQQGIELHGPTILHRSAAEQPHSPHPRMPAEPQKGLGTTGLEVLGVMGLIRDQHRASRGQSFGKAGPTQQLQLQL